MQSDAAISAETPLGGPPADFRAIDLAVPLPALHPAQSNADVYAIFEKHADWTALAVVEEETVIGLVDRNRLVSTFARPILRDLYERRPVARLMDPCPLVVNADCNLTEISHRISREKPVAINTGFAVVDRGRYVGVGSTLQLMELSVIQAKAKAQELNAARLQAEQASRSKTRFLAHISHELRTPLNAIIGFSELLHGEYLGPLGAPRYREYAGDIHMAARHLLELISDLLDIAKAEEDRLEIQEGRIDLRQIVQSCLRLMSEEARKAQVCLSNALPANLPALRGDERMTRQMILNLLSNALNFTPAHGRVTIEVRLCADGLALTVRDTGIGMSEAEQARALEPFGQVDTTFAKRHRGTGLGLPLTKRMIELHGGTLTLIKAPGQGTEATLWFPAKRIDGAAARAVGGTSS